MTVFHTIPEPAVGDTWIYPYAQISDLLTVQRIEGDVAYCTGRETGRREVMVSELRLVGRKTL